ncbi:interleukin-15 receptor subunit alpha [Takifugu flavidus]|uniref:interleukin-15 receptor subunit alpha n=1 Tax=Takifugu flavidus TaxID=433684 RepID=UPI00254427C7|nr:interleukin-15 receptor subunit alpha [Takifugu flavidus]
MDLGSSLAPLFVLIYWVFPTPATCHSDKICCPEIPPVNLTETPPRKCFEVGERYRYQCKAGYKRKAGTSNLIKCIQTAHWVEWTLPDLICICVPPGSCGEPSSPPPAATGSSTSVPEATTSGAVAATSDGGAPTETSLHSDVSDHHLNSTHIVSLCFALVFVCALAGMISFCYKRRTSGVTLPLPAEQIPINNDPLEADQ